MFKSRKYAWLRDREWTTSSDATTPRATWRNRSLMAWSAECGIATRPGLLGASVQMKTRAPRRRASPATSLIPKTAFSIPRRSFFYIWATLKSL
jgi:hypothetical protein